MDDRDEVYLLLSPAVTAFLVENGIDVADLLEEAKINARFVHGEDPTSTGSGHKEPAMIILASAALIAAATPLLREVIRNVSGRTPLIRERGLTQVKDAEGKLVVDSAGNPVMEWREIEHNNVGADKVSVSGFGISISFDSN